MKSKYVLRDLHSRYPEEKESGLGVLDFVWRRGSVLDALMYSFLFWPELVEYQNMIFVNAQRKGRSKPEPEQIRAALVKMRNPWRVEESFNLFELPYDLFGNAGDTTDEQVEFLAVRLAELWRAKLAKDFPNRRFEVKVLSPEETGGDLGITFYQVANPA